MSVVSVAPRWPSSISYPTHDDERLSVAGAYREEAPISAPIYKDCAMNSVRSFMTMDQRI